MEAEARRPERGELLLLGGIVIAQAIFNWHFASRSFFYADDFVAFQDALTGAYSPDFLFGIHGGHLSPGRRAVTLFIQYHATLDYDFALGLLLAAHSIGVVLVQRILRLVFGARWWTLAVAFAYGISIVIQPSLQWFSAGVLILPSATFGLAAIHGYLCWWRTGRRGWLVWSVAAATGGLLFYIKALLVPLYLVLIRVFLLDPDRSVRDGVRDAAREWRIWALYAIPVTAAITTYLVQGYGDSAKGIALHTIADYFETAWTVGFIPALFGIRVPVYGDATFHEFAVAGCQIGLIGAAALSIARRRSAWRPWALLVLVFVLNAVLVFPRLGFGPVLGYVVRYFTESVYFAAIVLPFAFARPRAKGSPAGSLGWPRMAILAPASVALALYAAFAWASDAAFTRDWPGKTSRAWVENLRGDLDALRARHVEPDLLNTAVPTDVLPFWIASNGLLPANSLAAVLAIFHPGLRFDQVSARTYRVRDDGHVEAVGFVVAGGGDPRALLARSRLTVARAAVYVPGRGLCVGDGTRPGSFEWRPPHPLQGQPWYLHATYRSGPATAPRVGVDRGSGYRGRYDTLLPPQPRGGTSLVPLGAFQAGPTVAGIRLGVPAGQRACFTRFVVGSYAPK
jgi:hypothetical protein